MMRFKLPPMMSIDVRMTEFRTELQEILQAPANDKGRARLIEISAGLLMAYDEKLNLLRSAEHV